MYERIYKTIVSNSVLFKTKMVSDIVLGEILPDSTICSIVGLISQQLHGIKYKDARHVNKPAYILDMVLSGAGVPDDQRNSIVKWFGVVYRMPNKLIMSIHRRMYKSGNSRYLPVLETIDIL